MSNYLAFSAPGYRVILVHGFAVSLLTLDRNQSVFLCSYEKRNHVIRHVAQNNNGDFAANGLLIVAVFF